LVRGAAFAVDSVGLIVAVILEDVVSIEKLKEYRHADGIAAIMDGLAADGGVIVRDFIGSDLLGRLNAELDEHIQKTSAGAALEDREASAFWGSRTKRFTRLAARTPSFAELLDHDLMHEWAGRALKEGYWLNTGQAMIVGPGEKGQVLHRDIALWPIFMDGARSAPEAMVSILLALSDFTEDVGATRVVPGSHLWDDFKRAADPEVYLSAVMPAGSALLYLGKTVHGAGANVTDNSWRRGLHMSFVLGWLTPEEASPIAVPWEIAKTYSHRVQQMLGYVSPRHRPDMSPYNWLIDFKDASLHLAPAR
jgi:ectoine hydroxylase-related dioxygenase (phytanoyl-CoA dioxygenase family)